MSGIEDNAFRLLDAIVNYQYPQVEDDDEEEYPYSPHLEFYRIAESSGLSVREINIATTWLLKKKAVTAFLESYPVDFAYRELDITQEGHLLYETMKEKRDRASSKRTEPTAITRAVRQPDMRKVFVVHGRNYKARDAVFDFLGSIGLEPLEWSQAKKATGKTSPSIPEILDTAFSIAGAVVVLFTPDEMAHLRKELKSATDQDDDLKPAAQSRPNVLFEAGIAMGRYPDRTVLVELGRVRPFTDISGIHVVKLNNSGESRQDLIDSLANAKCPIDISGKRRWHKAGDFEAALEGL